MRAIRYLAKYYEKKGSFKQAVTYLKKTGDPKKDLNLQSKILELTKKRGIKNPIWKSKLYCNEATIYSQAGGKIPEKNLMEKCAVFNNKSIYTKSQALDSLTKTFISEPAEDIASILKTKPLSKVAKDLLITSFSKTQNKSTYEIILKISENQNGIGIESESVLLESFAKTPNELTFNLIGKSILDPQ